MLSGFIVEPPKVKEKGDTGRVVPRIASGTVEGEQNPARRIDVVYASG